MGVGVLCLWVGAVEYLFSVVCHCVVVPRWILCFGATPDSGIVSESWWCHWCMGTGEWATCAEVLGTRGSVPSEDWGEVVVCSYLCCLCVIAMCGLW